MLNREKVAQKLQKIRSEIFIDTTKEQKIAQESWHRLCADPLLVQKIKHIDAPWLLPEWHEALDFVSSVSPFTEPYYIIGVDGSQIYPDRHEGIGCFLINTGVVHIPYGINAPVILQSEPMVFPGFKEEQESQLSHDMVNGVRQEQELSAAVDACYTARAINSSTPLLFLCDGSLIFWHLESKGPLLRDRFLNAYIGSLQQLYQIGVLNAGYISLPKSKELVNLIRVELCNFEPSGCVAHKKVARIVDTSVAHFFLKKYSRSTVFKSTAHICRYYPDHLVPYFFYMDVGHEIVRVEVPTWIARDEQATQMVAEIILSQTVKGYGYPVALSESHEQAVVKGPDREFFYLLLSRMSIEHKKWRTLSQKNMKKRSMAV